MSTGQINATQLLCRLLEQSKPEVNGAALLGGDLGPGGTDLIRERLLVIGAPLTYVTCPECGEEYQMAEYLVDALASRRGATGAEVGRDRRISIRTSTDRMAMDHEHQRNARRGLREGERPQQGVQLRARAELREAVSRGG